MNMKLLNPFEKHQYRIAVSTLKMKDEIANVMGGMTKKEARKVKKKLEGKMMKQKNPGLIKINSSKYDGIGGI